MALSFGFYDSLNGDRKYDARDFSKLIDALVIDGVLHQQGSRFRVTQGQGMEVLCDSGMAWFNSTWTHNDAIIQIPIPLSHVNFSRYHTVILEVNSNPDVRQNEIKLISGTASEEPTTPGLVKGEYINQYPLAHILVPPGETQIRASQIQIVVGTSACPFATGVLEGVNIDDLLVQWSETFTEWMVANDERWEIFYNESFQNFMAWLENIRNVLDGETAGNLLNLIDDTRSDIEDLATVKSDIEEHLDAPNPHTDSAPTEHNHNASDITDGILPIEQGGTGNETGRAATATILATARTFRMNLASTSTASFNGSANVTPGVTGVLPIANGGTGRNAATVTAFPHSNLGSWWDYPTYKSFYVRIMNIVILVLNVQCTSATQASRVIGTMPSGFRPTHNVWFGCHNDGGGGRTGAYVSVLPNGTVSIVTLANGVGMSGHSATAIYGI